MKALKYSCTSNILRLDIDLATALWLHVRDSKIFWTKLGLLRYPPGSLFFTNSRLNMWCTCSSFWQRNVTLKSHAKHLLYLTCIHLFHSNQQILLEQREKWCYTHIKSIMGSCLFLSNIHKLHGRFLLDLEYHWKNLFRSKSLRLIFWILKLNSLKNVFINDQSRRGSKRQCKRTRKMTKIINGTGG